MYAVIRAGGKQYRVAPGDVIHIERTPHEKGTIEFSDVLAVSGEEGKIGKPSAGARVVGSVVEEGRADKILVFHFKRKKQYKKIAGHRQPYTAVRITEIAFDGQKFTAPKVEQPERKAKPAPAAPPAEAGDVKEHKPAAKKHAAAHAEHKAPVKHAGAKHEGKGSSEKKHKTAPKKSEHKKKK
jgi:large subunit ribosomal protein L21